MNTLGNWLRTAREAKGLSLRDAEAVTRIRARYLQALEIGDYAAMPAGEAQVRGFLRRYASFLGLSPEEAITRYEHEASGEGISAAEHVTPPPPPAPTASASTGISSSRPFPRLALIGLGITAGAILLVAAFLFIRPQLQPSSESPSAAAAASESPTSTVFTSSANTPLAQVAQPTPTFPASSGSGVTVTLKPEEHVWVRVTADGFIAFEGMLEPDASQTWRADELVVVETGNGAGLTAVVSGQEQGALGGRAELSARGWGPEGELEVPPPAVPTAAVEENSP